MATLAVTVLSLSLAVPSPVLAQERQPNGRLETIVVTSTKRGIFGAKAGIPRDLVPQSVQVLGEEDLRASGVRSIEDALRAVPSATVARNRVGGFASSTLRLRGFAADQLRNGIPQRFYENTDPSALSNVARIEVLKGPSAVLYGQSGVGGVVSIITKEPTDSFQGSLAYTGGSYDQQMLTMDVGGPLTDTLGIRLTGEIERSGSFVDHLDVNRENLALTLTWRPSDRVSAQLVGEYLHRETLSNPGLPTVGTVIDNGIARVKRSTFLGEPDFSLQENRAPLIQAWVDFSLNENWTLTPRLQYNEWNNKARSTTLLPPRVGQLNLIERDGRNAGEEDRFYVAQLDLAGEATTFNLRHILLIGVEYHNDKVPFRMQDTVPCGIGAIDALNPVYTCGPPSSTFGFVSESRLEGLSLYIQDQIALTEDWHLVAGIRHAESENDNFFNGEPSGSADLSNTSWQLGSTYALTEDLSLYGGYNTGYDLGAVTGLRTVDGAPFKPETSEQYELGLRLNRDRLRADLSVFRLHRNDVGLPDPANPGFQRQEGQFRVQGFELEGEWSPLPGWWLQGGYAYLDASLSKSRDPVLKGARLAETPRHNLVASTRFELGPIELRAGANYVGERKMVNGGTVTLPDYVVLDLGLVADFGRIRVDAALTNLSDEIYYFSDNLSRYSIGTEDRVLPGDPRSFSLRLSYHFGDAWR